MNKIKKVLTALMNEEIHMKLRNESKIDVISDDLLYQEAVLDIIKENENIDFLLLNEDLPGEKIEKFIEKIKGIKIILFTENYKKTEKMKNIYKIFTNSENSVEEIMKIIKNEEENTEELKKEIEKLKEIIKNQNNYGKISIKRYLEKIINNKKRDNAKNKTIAITGMSGEAKAIFSISLAKELIKKKRKILLIDFDILNQYIYKLLKIENEKNIVKKHKYLDLLLGTQILFDNNTKNNIDKLDDMLENLKETYEYIIVNTSSECFFEVTKKILEKTEVIYFLIEENITGIKSSKKLLEIYWEKWDIKKSRFNIILNKIKEYSLINKKILKMRITKNIPYAEKTNKKIEEINQLKYNSSEYKNILKKITV